MKKIILFLLLLASFQAYSQKKGKVDPKDVQIDSLTQATVVLTHQVHALNKSSQDLIMKLDSVTKERDKYRGVYTAVSEKVMKYKFDPAKTNALLDSVKMHRDSTLTALTAVSTSLSDTIKVLKIENAKLQSTIQAMTAAEANKEKIVAELKQLKELLDSKIITQEEYDVKKTKLLARWE